MILQKVTKGVAEGQPEQKPEQKPKQKPEQKPKTNLAAELSGKQRPTNPFILKLGNRPKYGLPDSADVRKVGNDY